MLSIAIVAMLAGLALNTWSALQSARLFGTERMPWSGRDPEGAGWSVRLARGVGIGLAVYGTLSLIRELELSLWASPLVLVMMIGPFVVVTARHNRRVVETR